MIATTQTGDDLLQNLNTLARDIGLLQRQAGGVAAWSCQGLDAPTGSPTALNTIGMTEVACLAAILGEVANVMITSTFKRTN